MAYNNFFPATYQSSYNPYQQQQLQNMQQLIGQQQNVGFVSVRSEEEARNYPVAPGNSITFRNEIEPYLYTKTKSVEPFGEPVFTKYKLVKEDSLPKNASNADEDKKEIDLTQYALKSDLEAITAEIEALKDDMAKCIAKKKVDEK